jgi:protoporphyrinogen oxidase
VAVVGGGFTGLSCAVDLVDRGVKVEVFEKNNQLGGLAGGDRNKEWKWTLEKYYHHIFTNDKEIISMAEKVGLPPTFYSPTTSSFIKGKTLRLDSPLSVLSFAEISIWSRLRMGAGLALLKIIPNGLFLERYKVTEILPRLIGQEGYQAVWKKLLKAKFGSMEAVNMAWFWSRGQENKKIWDTLKEDLRTWRKNEKIY